MCLCPCESSSQPFYRSAVGFQRVIKSGSCCHITFTRVAISFPSDRLSGRMWSLTMYVWFWCNKTQTLQGINKCYYSYQLKITQSCMLYGTLVAQSILGAEVISSVMNYYIYAQFKHLCGQSAALEICIIFIDGKLFLLAILAQLQAFLRGACKATEASQNMGNSD